MGMENERIVYNPVGVGGGMPPYGAGFGFGSGGLLEGLLFASLFGRRGFGDHGGCDRGDVLAGDVAAKVVELQNTSDLKAEVNGVKSAIIHDLQEVQADLQREICDAKLDAVKAGMEAKIESLRIENNIINKVGDVATEIQAVKCHVDGKIAASTQHILDRMNADKLDEKNDEIAQLRDRNRHMEQTLLFSNQMNSLTSMIDSINQKLSNKVVQFGVGNIATPTNTQQTA